MSRPRQVRGLKSITMQPSGPWGPSPKLTGRAAEGMRFQKKVSTRLTSLSDHGAFYDSPWFSYIDTYGRHWCQPDIVVDLPNRVVVVEAKLSLRRLETGLVQLTKLYRPTMEKFFGKPAVLVLAFKHFLGQIDLDLIDEPEELLTQPSSARPLGWHYLT